MCVKINDFTYFSKFAAFQLSQYSQVYFEKAQERRLSAIQRIRRDYYSEHPIERSFRSFGDVHQGIAISYSPGEDEDIIDSLSSETSSAKAFTAPLREGGQENTAHQKLNCPKFDKEFIIEDCVEFLEHTEQCCWQQAWR